MIKKVKSVNNPYAVIPKNISSNFTQILTILLQLPLCPQTLNAIGMVKQARQGIC